MPGFYRVVLSTIPQAALGDCFSKGSHLLARAFVTAHYRKAESLYRFNPCYIQQGLLIFWQTYWELTPNCSGLFPPTICESHKKHPDDGVV